MEAYADNKARAEAQDDNNLVTRREAVGVFPDDEHLMAAIDELEMAEFARQDISVLGNEAQMRKTYDKPTRNPYNIEDDPEAPRGVHVAPEEQSLMEAALIGTGVVLAVFFMGPIMGPDLAMAGNVMMLVVFALVGGAIGYVAARLLRSMRANRNKGQRRKGGFLLWVVTPTRDHENRAQAILNKHGAHDVHVNEVVKPVA